MKFCLISLVRRRISPIVWVMLFEALILLMGNSHIVPDIMESRNLIAAREMVEEGNWLIPTMNGELRLAKPPLPTWISAGQFLLTGNSWAAQRIPAALAGCFMLYWLYMLVLSMTRSRLLACLSVLLLGTCTNFLLLAKTISWDIYCHTFLLGALYHLWLLLSSSGHPLRHTLLAGLFVGMSIMSKGPVSLYALFLPFVIACWMMYRHEAHLHLRWLPAVVLIALISGCLWYGYVAWSCYDESMDTLHLESGNWMNHSIRPWWYYITFFVETGLWAPLCLLSLVFPLWKQRVSHPRHYLFSLLWMVAALVLLSVLPEKKNRYLLPVVIPAAIAMAHVVDYWFHRLKTLPLLQQRLFRGISILILLTHISLFLLCLYALCYLLLSPLPVFLLMGLLLLCLAWDLRAVRRLSVQRLLGSVLLGFASVACFGMPLASHLLSNPHYSSPCPIINERYPRLSVYSPESTSIRIELVYDLRRKVTPVQNNAQLLSCAPCLFICPDDQPCLNLPKQLRERMVSLGHYNGDRQPPRKGQPRPSLCYRLYYLPPAP